jgi:hypothetical protein
MHREDERQNSDGVLDHERNTEPPSAERKPTAATAAPDHNQDQVDLEAAAAALIAALPLAKNPDAISLLSGIASVATARASSSRLA